MSEPIHILSLGAGVQSSVMALMAARGEIKPMPTAAVFADTGAEPESVYAWLRWLEAQLPFPVHHVKQAAMLNDRIMTTLIIQEYYKWDSYPNIALDLERLTQMAGATCYHPRLKETAETFNKESGAR